MKVHEGICKSMCHMDDDTDVFFLVFQIPEVCSFGFWGALFFLLKRCSWNH